MNTAEKFVISAMPLVALMGAIASSSTKKGPAYTYDVGGEYPVIKFTSAGGAEVAISFVAASTRDPQEGEGTEPVAVPASYTVVVDGVSFSTSDKHCPGKIKTAVRRAVAALKHAINKANGVVERSQSKTAAAQAREAAKTVLAKL